MMALKGRLEKIPGTWVNLFNSGLVVDLKKLQIKTVETLIKLNETTEKQPKKRRKT